MDIEPATSSLSPLSGRSPQTSQSAEANHSSPVQQSRDDQPTSHRQVKLLPYELREHCMIYFEEGLCRLPKALVTTRSLIGDTDCQALNLLTALLTSASASSVQIPVILPPPQHLTLIATLAVHPTLTTRAKTFDKIQASNLALQYLQLVLKHVGPLQSNLDEAFAFTGQGTLSRRGGRRRVTGEEASPVDGGFGRINNELASAGSLWARADNFWHVVGWCCNCSVLHKKRWERWSAWLSYMIDVLEADWEAREPTRGNDAYAKSLILKYIDSARAASGGRGK